MSAFLSIIRDFHNQWTLITASCLSLWCLFWVRPRFGITAASLLCYTGLSAIWVWVLTDNRYLLLASIDHHIAQAIKWSAADSFGKMIIVLLPLMVFSKERFAMKMFGELACYFFVLLNSLWIAVSFINGCRAEENQCGGLIGNPSIGVSLMVCMLPIFIHSWRKQWKILSLAALSVFASKSSIAMGLFAAYGTLWLVPWKSLRDMRSGVARVFLKASAFGACAMGAAKFAVGQQLTNDSERFHIWKYMMERWPNAKNIPTGTGFGTYHVFAMSLQEHAQQEYHDLNIGTWYWWNSLHNEPLEFLFVCGFIGFLLFAATYATALIRGAKLDSRLAIGMVLYGIYMTLNPALHHPIPALFGAWLFVYALRLERQTNTYEGASLCLS